MNNDSQQNQSHESSWAKIPAQAADNFVRKALQTGGADAASADAVATSLVGASLRGVDSHGLRLLPHYLDVLEGGRINGRPQLQFEPLSGATGRLDGDNAFGHLAGYRAVEEGIRLAEKSGIGAVTVVNSSHFGAAGSYPLAAAEAGYLCMAVSNTDKLVLPHDGVMPFHGTNPISFAAPVKGENPYLIDMATSSIPFNRVLHYQTIGRDLPPEVAVDATGVMTIDPDKSRALLPVGGLSFGFKGAALAGLCEVLCSALTGMAFSHQLLAINGPDLQTPRRLGHFFLVMKVDAFIDKKVYEEQMAIYLKDLRSQEAKPGTRIMAAGDREWHVQQNREEKGIPIDPVLKERFSAIAEKLSIASPDSQ